MEKRYTLFKRILHKQLPSLMFYYQNHNGQSYLSKMPEKEDLKLLALCTAVHEDWYRKLRLLDTDSARALFEGMEEVTFNVLKNWMGVPVKEYFVPSQCDDVQRWLEHTANGILDLYANSYRWIEGDATSVANMQEENCNWSAWFSTALKGISQELLERALSEKEIEDSELIRQLEEQNDSYDLVPHIRYYLEEAGVSKDSWRMDNIPQLMHSDGDVNLSSLKLIFDTDVFKQNAALLSILQEKKKLDEEQKKKEKRVLWMRQYTVKKAAAIREFALQLESLPLFETEKGTFVGSVEFQDCIQSDSVRYFLDHIFIAIMEPCSPMIETDLRDHKRVIEQLKALGARTTVRLPDDFERTISYAKNSAVSSLKMVVSKPLHAAALIDMGMTLDEFLSDHWARLEISRLFEPFLKLQMPLSLPYSNRQQHCYILGKSGSGKTELLKQLIHSDIQDGNGVFVLDPHGDLAEECLQFALLEDETIRKRLVYISPEFITKGYIPQYNPLEYKRKSGIIEEQRNDISVRAEELAGAFKSILKSEFSSNMELLLLNCIRLLLEVPNVHIGDLIKMLYPEGPGSSPYNSFLENHWDEELQDYFEHMFQEKRLSMAKSAIITRFTKAMSNQFVKNMLYCKTSSFDFKALLDEGKIIIVNAQQSKLSEAGTNILGALLTAEMTIMALGRANKPKEERHPVFAYIDECQNFLNDKIDKLLAEARKYGVHLVMANQFLGQFEGMGRLKESIFANTAIKFCGSASAQDKTTMSRELDFDFSSTQQLGKGRFVCRIDPYKGMVVQASSALIPPLKNNPNYTDEQKLEVLIEEQLQLYYRQFVSGEKVQPKEDEPTNPTEISPNIDDDTKPFEPIIEDL